MPSPTPQLILAPSSRPGSTPRPLRRGQQPTGSANEGSRCTRQREPPSLPGKLYQPTRLMAEVTALSEAVTMFASIPTPQTTTLSSSSPTSHSTYAAASASPPEDNACSV